MPKEVKSEFLKRGCEVVFSSNIKISDRFLMQQDSFEIDTLYYKKVIKISEEYPGIMDDLREFLRLNYNLKAIHIYTYSKRAPKPKSKKKSAAPAPAPAAEASADSGDGGEDSGE